MWAYLLRSFMIVMIYLLTVIKIWFKKQIHHRLVFCPSICFDFLAPDVVSGVVEVEVGVVHFDVLLA